VELVGTATSVIELPIIWQLGNAICKVILVKRLNQSEMRDVDWKAGTTEAEVVSGAFMFFLTAA
jgi:hypothetical protein